MDPVIMQDHLLYYNSSLNSSSSNFSKPLPTLEALSEPYQSVLTIIYIITAVVAFIENIIALIMLLPGSRRSQQLRKYLSNLAIADLLVAIFSIPFTYVDLMFGQWIFPLYFCPIVHFIQTIAVIVSIYTLIAIGIGRYLAIVTVLNYSRIRLKSHTKLIIATIWLFSILVASPLLIQARASPFQYGNDTLYDCREEWEGKLSGKIYTGIVFTLTFIVPFIALSFLYGSIGITVAKHRSPGNEDSVKDEALSHTKIKVVKMLLILVIAFAICWLPLQILNLLLWIFDSLRQVNDPFHYYLYFFIYFLCHWLSCLSSIINPFIYCFCSNNFKLKDLISIITCTYARNKKRELIFKSNRTANSVVTLRRNQFQNDGESEQKL